jgi:hypothetical protein
MGIKNFYRWILDGNFISILVYWGCDLTSPPDIQESGIEVQLVGFWWANDHYGGDDDDNDSNNDDDDDNNITSFYSLPCSYHLRVHQSNSVVV